MTKELVEVVQAEVTQADRDAAAFVLLTRPDCLTDAHPAVQVAARSRLSAEAAIVAWLRDFADRIGEGITPNTLRNCADTLEQGKIRHA